MLPARSRRRTAEPHPPCAAEACEDDFGKKPIQAVPTILPLVQSPLPRKRVNHPAAKVFFSILLQGSPSSPALTAQSHPKTHLRCEERESSTDHFALGQTWSYQRRCQTESQRVPNPTVDVSKLHQ